MLQPYVAATVRMRSDAVLSYTGALLMKSVIKNNCQQQMVNFGFGRIRWPDTCESAFTYAGNVTYAGDVTYESFLLLLFLEDNGIVFFCLLTISSGKSIVFDNSDHIKCLLIGTCRPYTVTYVGDATYAGFFWSLLLRQWNWVFFLVY